jgi:hypothetical protein
MAETVERASEGAVWPGQMEHHDGRMGDAGQGGRGLGREARDQLGGPGSGARQDNAVRIEITGARADRPAVGPGRQGLHRGTSPEPASEPRGQRAGERFEPFAKGKQSPGRGRAGLLLLRPDRGEDRAKEAPVVALRAAEDRKCRRDRDPCGVARKDTGDKRLDDAVGDLRPEAPCHEVANALVGDRSGPLKRLGEQAQLGARGEQPCRKQLPGRHRNRVHRPLEVHVPFGPGVGAEDLAFEAEGCDEARQLRGRPDGVRPGLEKESLLLFAADDAARSVGAFEQEDVGSGVRQRPRRGEAGEARAHDDSRRAHDSQKGDTERARSSSARRKVGRSFKPGVLRKCAMPASRAWPAKS